MTYNEIVGKLDAYVQSRLGKTWVPYTIDRWIGFGTRGKVKSSNMAFDDEQLWPFFQRHHVQHYESSTKPHDFHLFYEYTPIGEELDTVSFLDDNHCQAHRVAGPSPPLQPSSRIDVRLPDSAMISQTRQILTNSVQSERDLSDELLAIDSFKLHEWLQWTISRHARLKAFSADDLSERLEANIIGYRDLTQILRDKTNLEYNQLIAIGLPFGLLRLLESELRSWEAQWEASLRVEGNSRLSTSR